MLSLTDMWKASGSVLNREPFAWSRKEGAAFVEAVCIGLNLPLGQVYQTRRGKYGGGTWAHWQIAMAFAQSLSAEFHAHCNTIVRDHMERIRDAHSASVVCCNAEACSRLSP